MSPQRLRLGCERPVVNARGCRSRSARRIAVDSVPVIADVTHDLTRLEGQGFPDLRDSLTSLPAPNVKFDLRRGNWQQRTHYGRHEAQV